MRSVYGSKCLLHLINIALFGIVMILAIVSLCIYYLMPVADVTRLTKKNDVLGVDKIVPGTETADIVPDDKDKPEDDFYNVIATRNVFSPQRKDWVVKASIPKASKFANKSQRRNAQTRKKAFAGKPKKFVLHGILIAGNIKKALINNPLQGVRKDKTLYVVEGDDLDGYKVKSIEKDRIKLDWYGEEIVVPLYSGIKDNAQQQNRGNEVKKARKRMKRLEVNKGDISLKKQNGVQGSLVATVDDAKDNKSYEGPYIATVFNDAMFNPLSMTYKSLFMPISRDTRILGLDDKQEMEGATYEINIEDIDNPGEEHVITKVDVSESLDMAPEEGLNEKLISNGPTINNLHGMFIVDVIRKAMIDNPITGIDKKQTLYIEGGDALDVFRLASKKKGRIWLDWHGEERVVMLYSAIMDYKQKDYEAEGLDKTMETIKVVEEHISAKDNNKEVDVVTGVDDEEMEEGKQIISNVFDEEPLISMFMAYESLLFQLIKDTKMSALNDKQEVDEAPYGIKIFDIDHPVEEHGITKVDASGSLDMAPEEGLNEKLISKGTTIINLHGIFIVDGIGKAMIDIPFKGIGKKQTLYVEEGDELDGCRVASIYKEGIRLDCHGEVRVVTLNSERKDYKQEIYVAEGSNKAVEIMEADEEDISEKGGVGVDGPLFVAAVDDEGVEEGKRIINVFDDEPFSPMSMANESLFMPAMNDIKVSGQDEKQGVAEILPDLEVVDIDQFDELQKIAMVEPADSIYKVLEEEELKQKSLSKVPTQIILKGIMIAGNIKKALVNVPMSNVSANRTLYVEEGDKLEEYLVTEIEHVQIRLDWYGKEMIVAFPGLY
ncbi:MAG: hypothetical protein ACYSTS_04230 [Planctomycetota bacterium]